MLEGFHEQLVTHTPSLRDTLIRFGMVLGSIIAAVVVMYVGQLFRFHMVSMFAAIITIGFGIRAAALYKWEYEYVITAGDMDIDKITAQRSRKRMVSFRAADCEMIAPYGRGNYKAPYMDLPVEDYSASISHPDNYFAVYERAGKKTMIVFQPSAEMVSQLKAYNPKNVYQDIVSE